MDAIELIKEDHGIIKSLFSRFEFAKKDEDKRTIARAIFLELETHAMLEEQFFYPKVQAMAKEKSRDVSHGFEEHREVDALIQEMKRMDAASKQFEGRMSDLRKSVEHHIAEEERDLLPAAQEILGDALLELGNAMKQEKERAISVIDEQTARGNAGETG